MKSFSVLLTLLIQITLLYISITQSTPPIITSSTYQTVSISDITNTYSFNSTLFEINFDQDIYINHEILSNYNLTYLDQASKVGTQICLPKCRDIPLSIMNQIGGIALNCTTAGGTKYNFTSNLDIKDDNLGIPIGLIPVPNTDFDPLLTFALGVGFVVNDSLVQYQSTDPRKQSFIMFNTFIYENEYMSNNNAIPTSFPLDLSNGRCKISTVSGSTIYKNLANETMVTPQQSIPNLIQDIECRANQVVGITGALASAIDLVATSTNLTQLRDLSYQVSVLNSCNVIKGCMNLLGDYVRTTASKTASVFSTDLCGRSFTDSLYGTDPCCNTTLQWTQCCATRDLSLYPPVLDTPSNFKTLINSTCKNPTKSTEIIQNLISMVANSQNPITGCTSTYFKTVTQSVWSEYSSFISECQELVFGMHYSGYPCSSNSDCISGVCDVDIGECHYPKDNEQQINLLLYCHTTKMAPLIKSFLINQWGSSASSVEAMGGFEQLYRKNVVIDNCVGLTAQDYTEIPSSQGPQYVIANKTQCLSDQGCSYSSGITDEIDCKPGNYCVTSDAYFVDSITYPAYCYQRQISTCETNGGTFDPSLMIYPCRLSQFATQSECLPPSICPSESLELYPSYNKKRCTYSFCYNASITMSSCIAMSNTTWDPNLANGTGLCVYTGAASTSSATCTSAGGTWWNGRGWIDGARQTKEQCSQPLCKTGDFLWLDRVGQSCSNFSFCTQPAPLCYSNNYICSSRDNKTNCNKNGGIWSTTNNCTFTFGGSITNGYLQCMSRNYTWRSCSDLNETTCAKCEQGVAGCPAMYQPLQCSSSWRTDPYTPELCQQGGHCTDLAWYGQPMSEQRGCEFRDAYLTPDCLGVCLTNFSFNEQANSAYCPKDLLFSPTGCANFSIVYEADCISTSTSQRWWQPLAATKKQCQNTGGKVCLGQDGSITYKSNQECTECGGTYKSPFDWKSAQWVSGQPFTETQWIENASWGSLNNWTSSINIAYIEESIQEVLVGKFAPATQSDLLCNIMPFAYSLQSIACDCSGDINTPINCYSNSTSGQSYLIGSARVCNGWPDTLVSGPMSLVVSSNSVPKDVSCVNVQVATLPASQFYRDEILSTDVLSNSINQYLPYDVVVNDYNVIVGQLIGDGIDLIITYNRSGHNQPFLRTFSSPMTLCISGRNGIDHHFPTLDFAISSQGGDWVPQDIDVEMIDGRYCGSIEMGATYFPILRIDGWRDARPAQVFTKAQQAFIYIIGLVFILTALASAVSLARQLLTSGTRLTLPKLLNTLLFVFCMVRGLYLVLTPSQKISSTGNLGAFYFLSELPIYTFLSMFSALVFFWAEMTYSARSQGSFLGRLRIPFIVANTLMYIMFVVVISVYQSLKPSQQYDMKIVYSTILASLCIILIVGFWAYGGRLIKIQFKVLQIKNQKLNKNIRNMTLVVFISSISLTIQIIFLFFNAFSKRVTIAIALVYYVIAELIACLCLFYISRPTLKNKKTSKGSQSLESSNSTSTGDSVHLSKL